MPQRALLSPPVAAWPSTLHKLRRAMGRKKGPGGWRTAHNDQGAIANEKGENKLQTGGLGWWEAHDGQERENPNLSPMLRHTHVI